MTNSFCRVFFPISSEEQGAKLLKGSQRLMRKLIIPLNKRKKKLGA